MDPLSGVDAEQFSSAVSSELADALRSQGPDGERALNLLRDGAAILADPSRWQAPYEIAQSCCRSAIDSVLKLAPKNLPGIEGARRAVTDAAKIVAKAWHGGALFPAVALDRLADSVDALRAEEQNPGGQRIRQIGFLVQQQTRQELGVAEVEAVRNSWTRFYRDTSGVLHGSGAGPEETRERFTGVLSAFEQLFLGLPERADRLRELAGFDFPSPADADEVALMTDPRAGAYFFRAATSAQWLGLLPLERLLPEAARWPARPYLQHLLQQSPDLVCSWVDAHLEDIAKCGPGALSTVVGMVSEAGMAARPVLMKITKSTQDRHTLLYIGYWARDVAMAERTPQWVQVVEAVLRSPEYRNKETWEAAQLLGTLSATAHPDGKLRPFGDSLAVIIRNVAGATLSLCRNRPCHRCRALRGLVRLRWPAARRLPAHAGGRRRSVVARSARSRLAAPARPRLRPRRTRGAPGGACLLERRARVLHLGRPKAAHRGRMGVRRPRRARTAALSVGRRTPPRRRASDERVERVVSRAQHS